MNEASINCNRTTIYFFSNEKSFDSPFDIFPIIFLNLINNMLYYNKYYDFYDSGIKIQRLKSLMNERRTMARKILLDYYQIVSLLKTQRNNIAQRR